MKCPDREMLARLLDGEAAECEEEQEHIRNCPRCQETLQRDDALGELMRAFFRSRRDSLVREAVPCPGPEEIASYVEGRVEAYRKIQLLQHFCACPSCAQAALDASGVFKGARADPPEDAVREARSVYRPRSK